MNTIRPRRSVLYMPGSNARALEKAKTLEADCLIFDLEDAVAPEAKETARAQVADAVAGGGYGRREIAIRINDLNTQWGALDLDAAIAAKPDAILIPKVSWDYDLQRVRDTIAGANTKSKIDLWAMIETPMALLNIQQIALFAENPDVTLRVLIMGTNDLARETRAELSPGRLPMLGWLSTCVAAARAYGIDIIDGVYNNFRDETGFKSECEQGRSLGMDGKTLIHPAQIEPCNEVFSPGDADIESAEKIIAAFDLPENQDKGAITVDGRMVERLHMEMAGRTLAIAKAIAG